jgi:chromosome segregation protein
VFLKNLKIYGFKTFGKKVEIEFQKGITAIVGPNGAGKSNLIEALNWVLGESTLRYLRVREMQQLIFHGSPSLKPLSLAEVSITFDNPDNRLPIDYSEVNITRRISRDGQSEYLINRNRCALKDITNLFIDTGVGKNAYSVMRQGEIDRILQQKPEERREIFEEAAGILKYRHRRRDTERDLEKAENNLKQIRPTLVEVERQFTAKKKQAERAERYRKLAARREQVEIDIHLIRIFEIKRESASRAAMLEKLVARKQKILDDLAGMEKDIDDSLEKSQQLQKGQQELQGRIMQQEGAVAALRQKISLLEERRSTSADNIRGWEEGLERNTQRMARIDEIIRDLAADRENQTRMIGEMQDNLEKYAQELANADQIIKDANGSIVNYRKRIVELDASLVEARKELEQVVNLLVEAIDTRKSELLGSAEQKLEIKGAIERGIDELAVFLKSRRDTVADALTLDFAGKGERAKLQDLLDSLRRGLDEHLGSVEDLRRQFAGLDNLIAGFDQIIFAREGIHSHKEQIDRNIGEFERERSTSGERILELEQDIRNQQQKAETIRQMMHQAQISQAEMREKLRSIDENTKVQATFRQDLEKGNADLHRKIGEARTQAKELERDETETRREEKQTVTVQEKMKGELTKLSKDLSSISDHSSSKQKKLRTLKEELEQQHTRVDEVNRVLAGYEAEIRTIYDNFYENYSIDLRTHEKTMTNKKFDMAELRTELKKIKEEIGALGQINLLAVDECKELEERFRLLREQIADIEKSRKNLETIIAEINKNSEEIFHETFKQVRLNFHRIFRRLFDGGKADLTLTDPDNILESGIEITVQPPSKAMQTVGLLSGGEKSMTAIALLFSIFMVRPSPFCLLDEIDAALDGPNIERFKKLLLEFRESTQFLIISHNINTLKAVDALYGISMEDEGVTTAISLNVNELERLKKKYEVT